MDLIKPLTLVEQCLAGNEQAIETFVRTYETDIYKFALSMVNDPSTAAEVTQETLLAALRSLKSYREKSSLRAWLYAIALNLCRSHFRKEKIYEKLRHSLGNMFFLEKQKQPLIEEVLMENEKESAIWQALQSLNEKHREVVVMRYFNNLAVAEIAEILSTNEGTIHSRLHTAREQLRTALEPLMENDL